MRQTAAVLLTETGPARRDAATLEEIAERVKPYTRGILVQSIGQLEDEFDVETMMETEHTQKARFAQLVEYVRSKEPDCIPMAAGACQVCKNVLSG